MQPRCSRFDVFMEKPKHASHQKALQVGLVDGSYHRLTVQNASLQRHVSGYGPSAHLLQHLADILAPEDEEDDDDQQQDDGH